MEDGISALRHLFRSVAGSVGSLQGRPSAVSLQLHRMGFLGDGPTITDVFADS
jgi:hypothetical protein